MVEETPLRVITRECHGGKEKALKFLEREKWSASERAHQTNKNIGHPSMTCLVCRCSCSCGGPHCMRRDLHQSRIQMRIRETVVAAHSNRLGYIYRDTGNLTCN